MSIRDVLAAVVALLLLLVALNLAARLRAHRRRRGEVLDAERALGRRVIAEIPTGEDLAIFSEDRARFYFGDRAIDKDLIRAVRLLVNGSAIAASPRDVQDTAAPATVTEPPDGILRDRWDVAIDTEAGTILIECGAIRERVSQELARRIYDAVSAALDRRQG